MCHPAQNMSQNQYPGTLRIIIPGLENWKPLFWLMYFLSQLYFNFMKILPDVSVQMDHPKTWAKLERPFHCRHAPNAKAKSWQEWETSEVQPDPCGSYQGSLHWDFWLQVDNRTFPNILKSEDEKCCATTAKVKTFLGQTSGMRCFGAPSACFYLSLLLSFSARWVLIFLKKSCMPGLMLISPDSSRNGALCWSIGI